MKTLLSNARRFLSNLLLEPIVSSDQLPPFERHFSSRDSQSQSHHYYYNHARFPIVGPVRPEWF